MFLGTAVQGVRYLCARKTGIRSNRYPVKSTAGCDLCNVVETKERERGQERPICLSVPTAGLKSKGPKTWASTLVAKVQGLEIKSEP